MYFRGRQISELVQAFYKLSLIGNTKLARFQKKCILFGVSLLYTCVGVMPGRYHSSSFLNWIL